MLLARPPARHQEMAEVTRKGGSHISLVPLPPRLYCPQRQGHAWWNLTARSVDRQRKWDT